MSRYLYYFDLYVAGYVCTVRLNGYALQFESVEPRLDMYQVNPWIINGQNTIEVEILAGLADGVEPLGDEAGEDGDAQHEPGAIKLQLSVETDPVDYRLGEGKVEVLAEMTLDASDIEGEDAPELPNVFRLNVEHRSPLGTWLWQQAEILTMDEDDGTELAGLVAGIHALSEDRELDTLFDLLSVVFAERARAFGVAEETVREEARGWYQELFNDEDFALEPLDADNFAPRLHCDNRLLELVQSNGEPTIRQTEESDDVWGLPLLLGKIDGEWTVLGM